jgi:hypothetical protein
MSLFYLAQMKRVTLSDGMPREKKGELKMKASVTMLLKTNGEKMSISGLETMLMKTNELFSS